MARSTIDAPLATPAQLQTIGHRRQTRAPKGFLRAAAAFAARLANIRPRAFKCFFAHSFAPSLVSGGARGFGCVTTPAVPPVTARTRVLTIKPSAVIMLAMVTPCSRNKVRSRSAGGLFLPKTLDIVSRIWRTCYRSCRLRASMLSWVAASCSSAF